jgi:DNA-binding protein
MSCSDGSRSRVFSFSLLSLVLAAFAFCFDSALAQVGVTINDVSAYEGNTMHTPHTPFTFVVSLSEPSAQTVNVSYTTRDGTATSADSDYVPESSLVSFNPGETTKQLTIDVHGDTKVEPDETFTVELIQATGATIADGVGVATIVNDDVLPSVAIDDVTAYEGNTMHTPHTHFTFTVSLSTPSAGIVNVSYATHDGTATSADSDYVPESSLVSFNPGETSKQITIDVHGDTTAEADEYFTVELAQVTGATIADGSGTATILNDDGIPVTVAIDDVSAYEGNTMHTPHTPFVFTLSLSAPSAGTVFVSYATQDGTATSADADYVPESSLVTFNPGETSKQLTIDVHGDTKVEPDETFTVKLLQATGATITDATGAATILNDDVLPSVTINDVTADEGNTMHTPHTHFDFTVSLSQPSAAMVGVSYMTQDGTATSADADYVPESSMITFNPGETSKPITIDVHGDTRVEPDEFFTVTLMQATGGATIADANGIGMILDDDALPSVSINDVTAEEGNTMHTPHTPFTFTVSLSQPSGAVVGVSYTTQDGTATSADADYVPESSMITFNPGETSKQLTIDVHGDTKVESDESFTVVLLQASNATIADANGVGTILDDDFLPALSVSDVAAAEGNSGAKPFVFTVTLDAPSMETVTVAYKTNDASATEGDNDYTGLAGTLTFSPGQTSRTVSITISGDTKPEADETFTLTLSTPVNATIVDATGVGTIANDDPFPTLSINDVSLPEGNSGATVFGFQVTLSGVSGQTVTVQYVCVNGTATPNDSDYVSGAGTLSFSPGTTSRPIPITVNGDTKNEADETFTVVLSNPVGATLADASGTGTILNDDGALPGLTIGNVSTAEGNSGTKGLVFAINLSAASAQPVSVNYATQDGSATDADNDYEPVWGMKTLNPGETSAQVSVTINGDTKSEADETFTVHLSNPTNAAITDADAVGTITNDDAVPTLSISDVSQEEGDSGATVFNFQVTLSAVSGRNVTVQYTTQNGSATTADNDYTAANGTLTFPPGLTTQGIAISVKGDTKNEPNETFAVVLSNPSGATLADSSGVGGILNDDNPLPTVSIADVTGAEGNSGTKSFAFQVTLSSASSGTVAAQFATQNGSATVADGDYAAASGTLIFDPGETSKTVSVTVNGDTKPESDESFAVALSNPTNATLGDAQACGTITNDDGLPSLSVNDVTHNEGNSGQTAFVFTVSLSPASGQTVAVQYATQNGTATGGADFVATSGHTLTFNPGETTKTAAVSVLGDTQSEADETFQLLLSNPVNATVEDGVGVATITNDDNAPSLTIGDVSSSEGNSGTKALTFSVTLSTPSAQTVTVNYSTQDGTAHTSDDDYEPAVGVLTFNPGETSRSIAVTVNGDTKNETNETFAVRLANPTNASVADAEGTGTITNDDAQPHISIGNAAGREGDSGISTFCFEVTLTVASGQTVTVNYAATDGSATQADNDYQASAGTLTFNPGDTSKTISVSVNGDTKSEASEAFTVELSSPVNATIADGSGAGGIINDDGQVVVSIAGISSDEGDSGTTDFAFTVNLSAASAQTVSVNYATADGTATVSDNDYVAASGTLIFNPGDTSKPVVVMVNGDTKSESQERFTLTLSNPVAAVIGDGVAVGLITDDDTAVTLSIDDVSAAEGNSGATPFTFTVSLQPASGQNVTVHYAALPGSATLDDNDFAPTQGILTFGPGETGKTVTVAVNGDTKNEPAEQFTVALFSPVNATISDGTGSGQIENDDGLPSLAIQGVAADEGDAGTTPFQFTVTLSAPSSELVTVDYATSDGSATTADGDYAALAGTLSFSPGQTTATITVAVTGDTKNEGDESFGVTLSNPVNATLSGASANGLVSDDDDSLTYFPFYQGHATEFTGFAVANYSGEPVDLSFLAYGSDGAPLPFARNPYVMTLGANEQIPQFGHELFQVDAAAAQSGWIELASSRPVGGIFMFLGPTQLDGTVASRGSFKRLFFTRVFHGLTALRGRPALTYLSIANPHDTPITFTLQLLGWQGQTLVPARSVTLPAKGMVYGTVAQIFGQPLNVSKGYVDLEVTEGEGAVGCELIKLPGADTAVGLNASSFNRGDSLYSAQFAYQSGLFTNVKLINGSSVARVVVMAAINNAGQQIAASVWRLEAGAALEADVEHLFDLTGYEGIVGSMRVQADGPGVIGDVVFGQPGTLGWAAALPLQRAGFRRAAFNQVANGMGYFTGLAMSNFTDEDAEVGIQVYSNQGILVAEGSVNLASGTRDSELLQEFLPSTAGQVGGWVLVTSTQPLIAQQLFALWDLTMMSAVPAVVTTEAEE